MPIFFVRSNDLAFRSSIDADEGLIFNFLVGILVTKTKNGSWSDGKPAIITKLEPLSS
jgi:hypothetical protein